MRTFFLIGIALTIWAPIAISQIQTTTTDGKKVTLKEDGTWEYVIEQVQERQETTSFDKSICMFEKNEVDEFTGNKKITLKEEAIGKGGIKGKSVLFAGYSRVGDFYYLQFRIYSDLGCVVESTSKVTLKFENGEVLDLLHIGKTDCGDYSRFLTVLIPPDSMGDDVWENAQRSIIEQFKTLKVEKVRLQGSKYYSDYGIDGNGKNFLSKMIYCLE